MNVSEKLTAVAENVPKVYEAGKQAERNDFFDKYMREYEYQGNFSYAFAGRGWNQETFSPIRRIRPKNANHMFNSCGFIGDLQAVLEECGVELDTSNMTSAISMFNGSYITRIGALDCHQIGDLNYTFANTNNMLETIDKLIVSEQTKYTGTFHAAGFLKNIEIEGVIGQDIDIHYCTGLSDESLISIVNALKNYAGDELTHRLNVGQTLFDAISRLGLNEKIIIEKGWSMIT